MKISASKLHLFEQCAGVGALPSVRTPSTDDQAAGTGRHRFLERAAQVGREDALAEIPADAPWRSTCEAIDLTEIPRGGQYEVSYAYNCEADTARVLGQHLARDYDTEPTEVCGTADLVLLGADGWMVIDFKGEEQVDPAAQNLQLGFFAVCLARLYSLDSVQVAICYIRRDGSLWWDRATLSAWDLEAFADRMRALHGQVMTSRALVASGRTPDLTTGTHCQRCPSMAVCPAMTALVRELVADPSAAGPVKNLPLLSDEAAGRAWVRVELLEDLVASMKASLRARAEIHGLPLPDGSTIMPCETTRRDVVLDKALPLLTERYGAQVDGLVKRTLTAEAVAKLARQTAAGKGQRAAVEALWADLSAAGAVRTSRFVQLRPRKAGVVVEQVEGEQS